MARKSKIEVYEALMRNMIAGEVPLSTNVMREIQEPEQQAENRECTKTPEVVLQPAAAPDSRRKRTSAMVGCLGKIHKPTAKAQGRKNTEAPARMIFPPQRRRGRLGQPSRLFFSDGNRQRDGVLILKICVYIEDTI